mgnify:CR=1 FL=1
MRDDQDRQRKRSTVQAHEAEQDGTGMYPLKEKIKLLPYLLKLMLPAALIHLLSFWALYSSGKSRGTEGTALLLRSSILPFILASLYLLFMNRSAIRETGRRYFTRFERGRRFVIGCVISLAAAGAVLYYVVYLWELLSLPAAHLFLAAALIAGNLILTVLSYELASYLMFGILTWLISVGSFTALDALLNASPLKDFSYTWMIAQTGSFILAVLFAFLTNRSLVFTKKGNFLSDMLRFFGSRIFSTLFFEALPMYILINLLNVDNVISKFVGAFLVTIANYFLSKFFVFRGGTQKDEGKQEGKPEA